MLEPMMGRLVFWGTLARLGRAWWCRHMMFSRDFWRAEGLEFRLTLSSVVCDIPSN
jgi:hypothetical protein